MRTKRAALPMPVAAAMLTAGPGFLHRSLGRGELDPYTVVPEYEQMGADMIWTQTALAYAPEERPIYGHRYKTTEVVKAMLKDLE